MKDYYALLGLERNATNADVKKNYRLLATKYHPDKNDDPEASKKFIAITEAYDVLSNKKGRAQYDLFVWEKLKRKKASQDSYDILVPPRESTRTRRNKKQQKRSIKYHQAATPEAKLYRLVVESIMVVSRYITHIVGVSLALVVLDSVKNYLSQAFEKSGIQGVFVLIIIAAIVYLIYWICKNIWLELKRDVEAFSVFYKIPQKKALFICLITFALFLCIYILFLIAFG